MIPAIAGGIVLRVGPYCPYNWEPTSDALCFMVEIAREALAIQADTVAHGIVSWARALEIARPGTIAGAARGLTEEAPDLLYGIPFGSCSDALAVRNGDVIDPDDPATFAGRPVGVIDRYDYYGPIADHIPANASDRAFVQSGGGDQPLGTTLRRLLAGPDGMVVEAETVLAYPFLREGLETELDIDRISETDDNYIGFSPALFASYSCLAQFEAASRRCEGAGGSLKSCRLWGRRLNGVMPTNRGRVTCPP